jgi:hypothetical protein
MQRDFGTINRILAMSLVAGAAGVSAAQPQFFVGFDPFVQPNAAMPNASAADAAWTSAASMGQPIFCYDFNALPPGMPLPSGVATPLPSFPGGLAFFTPIAPATPGAIRTGGSESIANGWDTTTPVWFDPQNRLSLVVPFQFSTVNYAYDFSFAAPISAFAMYITGEGNTVFAGQMFLTFTDSNASWMIPLTPTIGGQFVGFVDPGEAITNVTLILTPDASGTIIQPFISLDDVCVVYFKPAGCAADFDGSGFVDGDDFDAFVRAFEDGKDIADFDGSGFVDGDDFDAFVRAFEKGC